MPIHESFSTGTLGDNLRTSPSARSKVRGESVKGERNKSQLNRQTSTTGSESSDNELKVRRQIHKQESKDSGIVTEMTTRPKEYCRSKTEGRIERSDSEKSKSKRNLKSRSSGSNVKRSQSMKMPSTSKHGMGEGVHSVGDLKSLDDSQIELMSPKQNGSIEKLDQDRGKSAATIKGMWKKAFKSLKSTSDTKLTKKGSLIKKKQNSKEEEDVESSEPKEIDPVYSLLKCAADLPKKVPCGLHPHCSGHHGQSFRSPGDSSESTSKTSSPSSSGSTSPDEKYTFTAANLRKKFAASNKASSLDIEDKKRGSTSPSPRESPKSQRKSTQMFVVLYNFKGKEKDDLDLRAGWRVSVIDGSDQDWWKGKYNGKVGYFPATYVIPLQKDQRVFQVTHPMHLTEGDNGMKLHKDQIVLQIGEEEHGMIHVQAANKKQAMCPLRYLNEV
ncbi:hypothetical protein FSP39_023068 [Pinctada imbricata]|uniref:SH3 domain-containing protein n=1 Tax=Pinctada imbricata TaxID=66713 RepID=A0AA88YEM9_PINIB|nr:hypothetical protein FSP39_023068 [Pinctada imbricata]